MEFLTHNLAPIMFAGLICFLLLGFPVAFSLGACGMFFAFIGVELGVWTSGDAVTLRQKGIPPMTTRVLAESTVTDPETAVAESVRILRALGKLPVPVLLHGEEGGAWPVLEYALRTKQDTRIGFEDVLQRPDGWLATGNDDLVRAAQAIRV